MKNMRSLVWLLLVHISSSTVICQNNRIATHYQVTPCSKKQVECLPELPRNPIGKAYVGYRYPTYYQGYPYYGVYNYGSFRGYSYSI